MYSLIQTTGRQREIVEVLLSYSWDYMRRLLKGDQTDEPELPTPAVLSEVLSELGPVYIKLGQLLSTRPDLLPPDYIEALASLQSDVPPIAWPEVEQLLNAELPYPMSEIFAEINRQPIAAGSIAQIHKATLIEGDTIAIKVQRPGLEEVVEQDIALIKAIAELISGTKFGQSYDVVALAEEFGTALEEELDFRQEANHTDRLRQNLAQSPWFDANQLVIPQVYWELTTPRILALGWLEGVPLLRADLQVVRATGPSIGRDASAENQRQAVTTLLFRAFFQQYLEDGFFHADPHPGNIFYLQDGRVALLDCGMVGNLDPRTRSALIELMLAIISADTQRCAQLTLQLAEPMRPVNLVQLENDIDRLLRRYYNQKLGDFNTSQAFYELLQAGRRNNLRWPGSIGLFVKSLANLEGVGRQFNPSLNVFEELRPLTFDLLRQQLLGDNLLQTLLRTGLEFRNLTLESPGQFGFLLNRLSTEALQWNVSLSGLDSLRRSLDDSANRISFSIVAGSLIMGAALITANQRTLSLYWFSLTLFAAASFLGLWLVISILRSGRLR